MQLSFDDSPYIAVIGDIKQSRRLQNRNAVQEKLAQTLDSINHDYSVNIASNFIIAFGDEFQGLLTPSASVVKLMDRIDREMYPVKIRFGIGVGTISTGISKFTLDTDGPAYYLARDMITALKAAEKKKAEPDRNILIKIQGSQQLSDLLNTAFSLMSTIKDAWTQRQVEIINAYLQNEASQTRTAKSLKINQSSVHRALSAANFYTYRDAIEKLDEILSTIKEAAHG